MAKLSQITAVTEVTGDDYFLITDDTTTNSRKIKWLNIESSIKLSEVDHDAATVIDGGQYAT
tara:strand:- start:639 stop:824 length:186 start_codon:yes stop_codon:yes gene_type:complete